MLILKGNAGKSILISELLESTHSECFVYYDSPMPFKSFFSDSSIDTLQELRESIEGFLIKHNVKDYLIIYTNETEDDLSGFIGWLEQNEQKFKCKNVILTCK